MKILFVTVGLDNYEEVPWGLTADVHYFRKFGNQVKVIKKENIWKFYLTYLSFRPDIVVSTGIVGVVPAFFKKFGLIRKPHIHMWEDYYGEQMGKKRGSLPAFMEMFTILNSDFITTVSKYNEVKAKILGKPSLYIPHGVQSKIRPTKIKLKGKTKIIYLGEQSVCKQVDKMIKAVKNLDCDLYLFGDPNKNFQKIANKNTHFMNFIHPEEVHSVLKQADILINPSDQDSSFKFFEYIRAGRPILGFKGRPGYVFNHGEDAYLTEDFAKGIKYLNENKKLREKIIKNMKKLKEQYIFSWEEIAKKHLKVYKKIISGEN